MSRFFISIVAILLLVGIAPAQDINVPKPTGDLNIKIGETSGVSFSRLPSRVTDDRLRVKGWKIETVGLKGIDLIAEAASSGTVQLARFQILEDRKSTRLNSSHITISYAVFCLKKKKKKVSISRTHYLTLTPIQHPFPSLIVTAQTLVCNSLRILIRHVPPNTSTTMPRS